MNGQNSPEDFLDFLISEINKDINMLYSDSFVNKYNLLDHLKDRVMVIENFIKLMMKTGQPAFPHMNNQEAVLAAETVISEPKTFTIDELSKYNGKNGNPAYVAINGVVYDVTDNPSWAAASHFGLTADHDVTTEFSSCHKGRSALTKLPVVGNLII